MTEEKRYDIFISYRREDGAQYAHILQIELEKLGYRVFLDYSEAIEGIFSDNLKNAIMKSSVFILLLSSHYLDNCLKSDDCIRKEIEFAIEQRKFFLPLNPNMEFSKIPSEIPSAIKDIIMNNQHFEIDFNHNLNASIDIMVKNHITSHVKPRLSIIKRLINYFCASSRAYTLPPNTNFKTEGMGNDDDVKPIFISYKRNDKQVVFRLKDEIEKKASAKCWIDTDGIESDAQFVNVIMNAIDNASVFLFMYSREHSAIVDYETDWTVREINYAQSSKKRIVFINIDGSPLTHYFLFMFPQKQQVDALSEDAIKRLCNDILSWLPSQGILNTITNKHAQCSMGKKAILTLSNNGNENNKSKEKYDFCLCYSKRDLSDITEICDLLRKAGCKCWSVDDAYKEARRSTQVWIGEGIKQSRYFLFFHSEHTNKSHIATAELNYAFDYGAKIISIKLDQSAYPSTLKNMLIGCQTIELADVKNLEGLASKIIRITMENGD